MTVKVVKYEPHQAFGMEVVIGEGTVTISHGYMTDTGDGYIGFLANSEPWVARSEEEPFGPPVLLTFKNTQALDALILAIETVRRCMDTKDGDSNADHP